MFSSTSSLTLLWFVFLSYQNPPELDAPLLPESTEEEKAKDIDPELEDLQTNVFWKVIHEMMWLIILHSNDYFVTCYLVGCRIRERIYMTFTKDMMILCDFEQLMEFQSRFSGTKFFLFVEIEYVLGGL